MNKSKLTYSYNPAGTQTKGKCNDCEKNTTITKIHRLECYDEETGSNTVGSVWLCNKCLKGE